jgi:hypothetical protein
MKPMTKSRCCSAAAATAAVYSPAASVPLLLISASSRQPRPLGPPTALRPSMMPGPGTRCACGAGRRAGRGASAAAARAGGGIGPARRPEACGGNGRGRRSLPRAGSSPGGQAPGVEAAAAVLLQDPTGPARCRWQAAPPGPPRPAGGSTHVGEVGPVGDLVNAGGVLGHHGVADVGKLAVLKDEEVVLLRWEGRSGVWAWEVGVGVKLWCVLVRARPGGGGGGVPRCPALPPQDRAASAEAAEWGPRAGPAPPPRSAAAAARSSRPSGRRCRRAS